MNPSITDLSNAELLCGLQSLVRKSSRVTATIITHIGEVDARRLYADAACSSMHAYCTRVLGMSGSAAYERIRAGRAARRFPVLLGLLAEGKLHVPVQAVSARTGSPFWWGMGKPLPHAGRDMRRGGRPPPPPPPLDERRTPLALKSQFLPMRRA